MSHVLETRKVVEMANFVVAHRFPRVMMLIEETFQKVLNEGKPTLIMILKDEGRLLKTFKSLAEDYSEMNMLYTILSDKQTRDSAENLFKIIGIQEEEAPVLVMLPFKQPENGIIPKYKTSKLTKKNIKNFIDQALLGKAEMFYKSEAEDNDKNRLYTQVTLNNFDKIVGNSEKFFVLGLQMFQEHMPQDMKPVWNELAESIEELGLNGEIEVGICDIYKNEISPKVEMKSIPQIMLMDAQDKTKFKFYQGEIKAKEIRVWIQKETGIQIGDYIQDPEIAQKKMKEKVDGLMAGEIDL